jgi:hypothetical protein
MNLLPEVYEACSEKLSTAHAIKLRMNAHSRSLLKAAHYYSNGRCDAVYGLIDTVLSRLLTMNLIRSEQVKGKTLYCRRSLEELCLNIIRGWMTVEQVFNALPQLAHVRHDSFRYVHSHIFFDESHIEGALEELVSIRVLERCVIVYEGRSVSLYNKIPKRGLVYEI